MSSLIKLLPENVANQIAAGEVVQRPSSVVKELLENSVDCGSKNIKLIIKHAGKTLIQVIDDGLGMNKDDLSLCYVRHATSKIRKPKDLFDLKTRESKSICDKDPKIRNEAIEEHKEWIDVAKSIGCSSIRVNLWSEGMSAEEVKNISEEGLGKLLEYSSTLDMSIVIENHGGFTSDAAWLVDLMKSINHPNLGTLPDFGTLNFCIERAQPREEEMYSPNCLNQYDKYKGVEEMLPYAKGISAKSINFDNNGNETNTDFERMIKLIKSSSFEGYMAIEYEGALMQMFGRDPSDYLSSNDGILATKKLIEKYI